MLFFFSGKITNENNYRGKSMKKIIVYNLFFITAWFLVACASYEFPEELKILGYNPEDLISYRHLEKTIIEGKIPKAFWEEINKYSVFQTEKLLDYYFLHLQGYSIIQSLNLINHPRFLDVENKIYPAITVDGIILVNSKFRLASDYIPSDLVTVQEVGYIKRPNETMQIKKSALSAYSLLYQALQSFRLEAFVFSAYRPYEKQQSLWEETDPLNRLYLAKPGHSEHQTGLALDVSTLESGLTAYFENTAVCSFLAQHAHEFGFILRYPQNKEHITGYPYEAWHYRFVGIEHAKKIFEQNLCLEEYLYFNYPLPLNPN
jgi:LAS superfamily LD-carboxypeptidase LdcB